jgi:predicted RNA-binding protein YlxR (DUF448 family)/ribosomal protein L7Ae-like RNA K-turn-binding protein
MHATFQTMHSTPIPPPTGPTEKGEVELARAEQAQGEQAQGEQVQGEPEAQDALEPRRVPGERTCAGCGQKAHGKDMVRVVLGPWNGKFSEVAVDFANGAMGRGAHVHASVPCLQKAVTSGFSKSFKSKVSANVNELARDIVLGSERAVVGLLTSAIARRRAAVGADTSKEAMKEGAPLLLVASDAGSIASEFHAYTDEGRVQVFGDKKVLGKVCGKSEVAVVAITDENIASAIVRATTMAGPFRGSSGSEACMSPEVR